jgi:thymidine phosphorylase
MQRFDIHVPSLIERKRDGQELTAEEIDFLVSGFTHGEIPEYQISAWLMATFFQGMTAEETQHLTTSMMQSGTILEYPKDSPPKVDKHSTGGVGDKVSLILAPLLACDDLWVPMISVAAWALPEARSTNSKAFRGSTLTSTKSARWRS